MPEQEIIAACKNEMWKRFPRSQIVIGRPSSTSQYDRPYQLFGIIVKPFAEGAAGIYTVDREGQPAKTTDVYTDDVKAAFIAAASTWFDTLRSQGSVLVIRRALEWSTDQISITHEIEVPQYKLTFRAHAANTIMLYTSDYAEKMGDLAANPDLGSYVDRMRKALA